MRYLSCSVIDKYQFEYDKSDIGGVKLSVLTTPVMLRYYGDDGDLCEFKPAL